jgi:hypothetical protein
MRLDITPAFILLPFLLVAGLGLYGNEETFTYGRAGVDYTTQ